MSEPKRGKWQDVEVLDPKFIFDHDLYFIEQKCSSCDLYSVKFKVITSPGYCPRCGAKMEYEKND